AQQPQHRRLVHADLLGQLVKGPRPLGQPAQQAQRPVHALTHPDILQLAHPRSSTASSSATRSAGSGGPTSSLVRSAAAACRWPARSRRTAGSPASVAARNPAAKASPAPTGSTTSTRSAGTNVVTRPSIMVAPCSPCL